MLKGFCCEEVGGGEKDGCQEGDRPWADSVA